MKRLEFRSVLPRVIYDVILSFAALAFAFVSRSAVYLLMDGPTETTRNLIQGYYSDYARTAVPLAVLTLIVMAAFGFYSNPKNRTELWRPGLTIGATTVSVFLFTFVLYFTMREPYFSRGVLVFLWFYLTGFIAVPRILKYFMARGSAFRVDASHSKRPKNILVIGGAGYIGSHLVRDLLDKGFRVRVLDSLMFGNHGIKEILGRPHFELVDGDFRNVQTLVTAMRDMDAVVHLGGIVGDPACSLDDDFTVDVNLTATTFVAEACKIFKIKRLIFASTCSVYGSSEGGKVLTEESDLNPVSLYARTKIASERVLLQQVSEEFCPTILRFSTLFGLSPRPRFDLVVNVLTAKACKEKEINVFGGNQWRPFVHVHDAGKAIVACLEAPLNKVRGEVFNVGSTEMNYQIVDIGKKVVELIPGTKLNVDGKMEDARNYNVSFKKIESVLGIKLSRSIEEGITEMRDAFNSGLITDYKSPEYSNVSQTERVISDQMGENENSSTKKTSKFLLQQV